MATRDEPLDPQEVLAAAEAAHLAARRTVPISRADQPTRGRGSGRDDPAAHQEHPTIGLDRQTVRLRLPRTGTAAPAARPAAGRAPLPVAAAVAAGWAALASFVPVALLVLALQVASGGLLAVGGPVRLAATGWLLAHGVPVQTPVGPVGLIPLAVTVFAAWRVARAGVHVTRVVAARGGGPVRQALVSAASVAVGYGAIGALTAALAGGPDWGPPVPRAALTLAVFGLVTAGYGALRTTGVLAIWTGRVPRLLRDAGRAGAVAALLVLGAGAAVAGVAVAANGGTAADIIAAYRTDASGQAGLTLLCLVYAPNLAAWAAAYLAGPGFAVGTGTLIRSSEVTSGPLPGVPVFAGLPDGPLPTLGALLLVVPIVAGAAAGWLLVRWTAGWSRPMLGAAGAGVVAGGLLGFAAMLSGGPLGTGQLAQFGPDPWLVSGFSAATITAGALLGALAAAALASSASRLRRRRHR